MNWILCHVWRNSPFAFVMCHFGENCMGVRRAQIYHLKWVEKNHARLCKFLLQTFVRFEERTNKIFRRRRRTTIVSTLNANIKRTKGDDITFPVTPLVSQVSLQNLNMKAKNRKLWSKIVQQVVKSAYFRWSRWSMPHSDWKEKRLRNIT